MMGLAASHRLEAHAISKLFSTRASKRWSVRTTNVTEYLKDLTGNRRFWPVKTAKINLQCLEKVREQLFAEAVAVHKRGEKLYLENPRAAEQALAEQGQRAARDEWLSTVSDILNSEGFNLGGFQLKEVAARMGQFGADRLSPSDSQRITRCLKLLGCDTRRETNGQAA